MRQTPIDIVNKRFPRGFRGFQSDAVQRYLIEVADDYESVLRERAALIEQVETLKGQLDRYSAMETTIKSAAITADRNADQTRENARQEAANTVRAGQQQANQIIADAERESVGIRAELDRLHVERDRFVIDYMARLRAELDMLERYMQDTPPQTADVSPSADEEEQVA